MNELGFKNKSSKQKGDSAMNNLNNSFTDHNYIKNKIPKPNIYEWKTFLIMIFL